MEEHDFAACLNVLQHCTRLVKSMQSCFNIGTLAGKVAVHS